MAIFMGFPDKAAAAISIIGGADGPKRKLLGLAISGPKSVIAPTPRKKVMAEYSIHLINKNNVTNHLRHCLNLQ